nr:retrovirus-related Pol polyprotein from transposon TNT 1-94 [Tanacetum cinerariifolium]
QDAKVIAPIAKVIPQVADDSTGSPSLTDVDQDAPSPSKSLTPTEIQSPVIPQEVGNDNMDIEVAHMGNDPFLKAVATACFTHNRSIIRLRHGKTPYELMHGKQPELSYFHVFGALCYPTNDGENVGKLQPKADIGIFIGYAPTKKAFRIYNRRTRQIVETIHVDFDELIAMASEQSIIPQVDDDSTGSPSSTAVDQDAPSPSKSLTPTEIQSSVILQDVGNDNLDIEVAHMRNDPLLGVPLTEVASRQSSSTASPQTNDLLFQPLFDELLNPPSSIDNQAAEVIAPITEVILQVDDDSTGSPSLTTVDHDAPSPSKSPAPTEIQSSVILQDVGNDNLDIEVAHMGNDPLLGAHIPEVNSEQSSSTTSPQSNVQPNHPMTHHNSKWTKDHPMNYIIGPLSRPVSTRLQLHGQALFCYYNAFLTSVEPKTFKEALTQACWIEAMQEELHKFKRLEAWELLP